MARQNVFVVQHYERRMKDLVGRSRIMYRTLEEATARAERDADMFSGVATYEVIIETETGEEVGEPKVLTRFGEVGQDFHG